MHSRTGINISFIPAALIIYAVLCLCPISSAYADYTDPETYSYDFLVEMADEAGVTPNEFVVNYVFMSQVYTGNTITNQNGMQLVQDVATNLENVEPNDDFPSWDELTEQQKQGWTEINYNAERFNQLVMAGSGGRGLNSAKEDFYGSGGNDFSWTDTAHDALVDIGHIAQSLLNGVAGVAFGDIVAQFDANGKQAIQTYIGMPNYQQVNGSDYDNWPANAPANIYVNKASGTFFHLLENSKDKYVLTSYSADVYVVAYMSANGTSKRLNVIAFSKNPFMTNYATFTKLENVVQPTPNIDAQTRTYQSNTYYYDPLTYANTYNKEILQSDVSVTGNGYLYNNTESTAIENAIPIILFGDGLNFNGNMIPNYPETVQTNINIYYPENGINNETPWLSYVTAPSGGGSAGDIDLSELITILRSIESKIGLLDSTSEDLSTLETAIAQFKFYTGGILKVHDEGLFDSLTDIGSDIHDILTTLTLWPKGDAPDAPDIIGDFDFDELSDKSDLLLESVSDLAPFGALLLLSEMVGILSQTGNLEKPEMVIPFDFMPGHSYDVTIDLSWLDAGKVYINFFCILSLILCLLNITIRIVELEAAS